MADQKRVEIVGTIDLDAEKLTGTLEAAAREAARSVDLNETLMDLFRKQIEELAGVARGVTDVGDSLEDVTAAGKGAETATGKLGEELKDAGKAAETAGDEVGKVREETERTGVVAKTFGSIWHGVWTGVGIQLFDSIASGIRGIIGWLVEGMDDADEFADIFELMAASGVQGADKLKDATRQLRREISGDLLPTANAVKDAIDAMVPADAAIAVAKMALKIEELTGAEARENIRSSAQLVKAFNEEWKRQPEIMAAVALAARRAGVSQQDLHSVMARIAPLAGKIGVSFSQLLAVTEQGMKRGLQPAKLGLQGMGEVMEQIVNPSEDFRRKLMEIEGLNTPLTAAWKGQTAELSGMRRELEALNRQLEEYRRQANELAQMGTEAQTRLSRYEALTQRQEQGERLNRLERRELRELKRELKEYNEELSQYDKAARFVADIDFKRLNVADQLKQRLENLKLVQGDLAEDMTRAQNAFDEQAVGVDNLQMSIEMLAETIGIEMPAAVAKIVSEQGLSAFFALLSKNEPLLSSFSGQAQTFLASYQQTADGLVQSTGHVTGAAKELGDEWGRAKKAGLNAVEDMKENLNALKAEIGVPLNAIREQIAGYLSQWFNEENLNGIIAVWGEDLVEALRLGIEQNKPFSEILREWIEISKNDLEPILSALRDLWNDMKPGIIGAATEVGAWMADAIVEGLKKGLTAFATSGWWGAWAKGFYQPVTDLIWGGQTPAVGSAFNYGSIESMPFEPMPMPSMPAGQAEPRSQIFHINGAQDPVQVAKEVGRILDQQARLGITGNRRGL
jgi:hypothetical protein